MLSHVDLLAMAAVAIVVAILLGAILGLWVRARIHAWSLRRRFRRGLAGQREARVFLEANGYEVLGEEVVFGGEVEVDGALHGYDVRVDFVVASEGRRYGVEVKTGAQAVDPLHRATRRQLLEYFWLARLDGLLLLDMEARRLASIRFPMPAFARPSGPGQQPLTMSVWRVAALALALALVVVLLTR